MRAAGVNCTSRNRQEDRIRNELANFYLCRGFYGQIKWSIALRFVLSNYLF